MIKSELIEKLSVTNPHLMHRDVEKIVNVIFEEITSALARGDRVELRGFGAFSIKHRPARVGRNPRTGDQVQVPEKFVPYFKTGKELRIRLIPPEAPTEKPKGRKKATKTTKVKRHPSSLWRRAFCRGTHETLFQCPRSIYHWLPAGRLRGRKSPSRDLVADPFIDEKMALSFQAPLSLFLFVALFAGVIIGWMTAWVGQGHWRKRARDTHKEASIWKREAENLKRGLEAASPKAITPPAATPLLFLALNNSMAEASAIIQA